MLGFESRGREFEKSAQKWVDEHLFNLIEAAEKQEIKCIEFSDYGNCFPSTYKIDTLGIPTRHLLTYIRKIAGIRIEEVWYEEFIDHDGGFYSTPAHIAHVIRWR